MDFMYPLFTGDVLESIVLEERMCREAHSLGLLEYPRGSEHVVGCVRWVRTPEASL